MQLPDVDAAIIDEDKIVGYLLNPDHPVGASKARFFQRMGFPPIIRTVWIIDGSNQAPRLVTAYPI